mmetsp:Transcript_28750/g.57365  ORF Transcript_28750/g.57365 Transcript_28750/m.57365 type:complete len:197 (+) Transcript_28750:28-618(+)
MKFALPDLSLPLQSVEGIYHERQHIFNCAMHTLNNLLGAQIFDKYQLDEIAKLSLERSGLRPSVFSVLIPGYWDANVIQMSLFEKGYSCEYFDTRRPIRELNLGPEEGTDGGAPAGASPIGLVLNVAGNGFMRFSRRHWCAIRRMAPDLYADVNSKLVRPRMLMAEELRAHLGELVADDGDCTVFIVRKHRAPSTD